MAKPTINDVARLAGVSKKTVSRVINQSPLLSADTRAKVEAIIAEIGYAPDPGARALAMRRNTAPEAPAAAAPEAPAQPAPARVPTFIPLAPAEAEAPAVPAAIAPAGKLIALVYDPVAAPQLADVQHGALAAIRGSGHALAVHALGESQGDIEDNLRDFLTEQRPAGVLFLPPLSEHKTLARLCGEMGISHVGIAAGAGDADHLVASADRQAAAQVVAYLISLGHERIGMITGPEDSRLGQERELGYLDAMADHDLDRGPALIANGDHGFVSGFEAGTLLLEVSPRPTAIFAGNDEMAAGVLHAAAQKGIKVPEALSIVGFEDTPLAARLNPQLTTVRVPLADMAGAAARRLIDPASAAGEPARFPTELVVRGSTGPCPV